MQHPPSEKKPTAKGHRKAFVYDIERDYTWHTTMAATEVEELYTAILEATGNISAEMVLNGSVELPDVDVHYEQEKNEKPFMVFKDGYLYIVWKTYCYSGTHYPEELGTEAEIAKKLTAVTLSLGMRFAVIVRTKRMRFMVMDQSDSYITEKPEEDLFEPENLLDNFANQEKGNNILYILDLKPNKVKVYDTTHIPDENINSWWTSFWKHHGASIRTTMAEKRLQGKADQPATVAICTGKRIYIAHDNYTFCSQQFDGEVLADITPPEALLKWIGNEGLKHALICRTQEKTFVVADYSRHYQSILKQFRARL